MSFHEEMAESARTFLNQDVARLVMKYDTETITRLQKPWSRLKKCMLWINYDQSTRNILLPLSPVYR